MNGRRESEAAESEEPSPVPAKVLGLTASLVSAYVGHNQVPTTELMGLVGRVYAAISHLGASTAHSRPDQAKPAVPIKRSVTDEHLICLEDGQQLTMLKRYLRSQYDMSPEQYRAKWGLPHDYPMVAPAYARLRSAFAKKIGLGRKPALGKRKRSKPE